VIGIKGAFTANFEEVLFSGDKADLILEDSGRRRRICVEVKSHISADEDLIRGIFQCVKYGAVLEAQEKYELRRSSTHRSRKLQTFLVTERELPEDLKQLSDFLNVQVCHVKIPPDYKRPHQS
jgi:hypothetical protein